MESNHEPLYPKQFSQVTRTDFDNALRKGFWRGVISWLTGNSNELLPFEKVQKYLTLSGQHSVGVQQIPIENIIGSVGRYNDFDRAFLPRRGEIAPRWMNIDLAHLQDVELPPIEVYKIGEAYFVKDGNHRVSVARDRGQAFIDADIIEIDAPMPLTPEADISEWIRQQEMTNFLSQTAILEVRPDANLELSIPGFYSKLLEHISTHRWFMGVERNQEIPFREAVVDWYDTVYFPLIKIIREQEILMGFPGRTETDLYLWILDDLYFLREVFQQDISYEDAAVHFSDKFANQPIGLLRKILDIASRMFSGGFEDQVPKDPDEELRKKLDESRRTYEDPPADNKSTNQEEQ
ncbi:MAG: transcriptional regulator [Anaerolineaceae bacterium]